MISNLIAVATRENGTISPHAGRATLWRVYVVTELAPAPEHVWDLQLTEAGCLHEWHVREDSNRHPLHSVNVAISGSAGEGVRRRLGERGVLLFDTSESDPVQAVQHYVAGTLKPGKGHDEKECLNPDHHHEHAGMAGTA